MIGIRNISVPVGERERKLKAMATRMLKLGEGELRDFKIIKKSLDARKKSDIRHIYTVACSVKNEERVLKACKCKNAFAYTPFEYTVPAAAQQENRPVVVGFGPAGMFAALRLSMAGLRPIVIERGEAVEKRRERVDHFWKTGELSEKSNVQFGEGGAGTFSDGKLNTGTHDVRIDWVLKMFHAFGAPECVTYDAKPHVGTDVLEKIVKNLRERIISLGGELRFSSKLVSIKVEGGALREIMIEDDSGSYALACDKLILALGHSARDTFEMLKECKIPMERKPFSIGVRIEHKQEAVSLAQYGAAYKALPPADYKLSCTLPDGSRAYTFCVCPGGLVVAAASEVGGVVTNGMSYSRRDGENVNSALLVPVLPENFPGEDALSGMYFQREIEKRAFDLSGAYLAPAQTVGDFLAGQNGGKEQGVSPSYKPGVHWCDLREVLPKKITDNLAAALPLLAAKASFFADPGAVMSAPETRSSSPVRILRGDGFQSAVSGLFPCGEGAGYAGGIISAAVDGLRCAEAVAEEN